MKIQRTKHNQRKKTQLECGQLHTHSLNQSLNQSLIHSMARDFSCYVILLCAWTLWPIFTHSFAHSFTQVFIHSLTPTLTHPLKHLGFTSICMVHLLSTLANFK